MVIAVVIGILGAILASFVGVLAERLHTGASWANDRSRCDSCSTTLKARDLIPVLSWILSRGTCRTCGVRVPVRHALVEGLSGLIFASAYLTLGASVSLSIFLVAVLILLFIVLYDMRHTIVPFVPVLVLTFLALLFRIGQAPEPAALGFSLLIAGTIGTVFLAFFVLSNGRAMGLGDAPVALGLSLLVGPFSAISGLLFSFWIGALYGIVVLVTTPKGHRMGIEVPFVPFLALGFLLAYFTGWNPLPLF